MIHFSTSDQFHKLKKKVIAVPGTINYNTVSATLLLLLLLLLSDARSISGTVKVRESLPPGSRKIRSEEME